MTSDSGRILGVVLKLVAGLIPSLVDATLTIALLMLFSVLYMSFSWGKGFVESFHEALLICGVCDQRLVLGCAARFLQSSC